jgi:hypothetical protein
MSERGRKKARIELEPSNTTQNNYDPPLPSPSPGINFQGLPGEIKKQFFAFLDVKTLYIKREVSREWKQNCEHAIEDKKKDGAGVFTTRDELKQAVKDYYKCKYERYTIALAEKVARDYGWFIGRWNVSAVTNFSWVFYNKIRFNDPIGDWAVGNGTTFEDMFTYCHAFDQDLSKWDMSKATSLERMFCGCSDFNQDLPWNVANVKSMWGMFSRATSFTGNISTWNTVNVVNAQALFYKARAFNEDIGRWNLSKCTNMSHMFNTATSFNQNLEAWSTENVTSMMTMFSRAAAFRQNLSAWDVSSVENFGFMFFGSRVTEEDLYSWEGWHATLTEQNDFRRAFHRHEEYDSDDDEE